jgi:hypothetical protein
MHTSTHQQQQELNDWHEWWKKPGRYRIKWSEVEGFYYANGDMQSSGESLLEVYFKSGRTLTFHSEEADEIEIALYRMTEKQPERLNERTVDNEHTPEPAHAGAVDSQATRQTSIC